MIIYVYVSNVPEDCREARTVLEILLQANIGTFCAVNQATEVAFLFKCHRQSSVYLLSICLLFLVVITDGTSCTSSALLTAYFYSCVQSSLRLL